MQINGIESWFNFTDRFWGGKTKLNKYKIDIQHNLSPGVGFY